jgi:hypothetical protein
LAALSTQHTNANKEWQYKRHTWKHETTITPTNKTNQNSSDDGDGDNSQCLRDLNSVLQKKKVAPEFCPQVFFLLSEMCSSLTLHANQVVAIHLAWMLHAR